MEMDLTLDLWGVDNPEEELEKLRQQVMTCTACRLAETRTNVVFGEGNPRAPLVFVGEGPGEHEDATGRPFVGRAGALLDQALRENGLSRKHVYICNIIKCRASVVENGRVRNRPPYADEIAACHPWLDKQLTIIQPLVIVCLGAPAANTLIHKNFKMTQERGIWYPCAYARYAMATLHPAYILRQEGESYQQNYRLLVQDIAAARQKVIEAKKEPKTTLF